MKGQLRKIFSLLLVTVILSFSISVSSFSVSENLINPNMSDSSWTSGVSDFIPTITYDSSTNTNTIVCQSGVSGMSSYKYTLINGEDVFTGHTYKFTCKYGGYLTNCPVTVYLNITDVTNTLHPLIIGAFSESNTGDLKEWSFEINLSDLNYDSIIRMQIEFDFKPTNNSQHTLYFQNISFIDTDGDNTSLWSRLWDFLQGIMTRLANIVSSVSSGFSNLWNNISSALSTLTNNIGNFFVNLGDDIAEFFDTLRDWLLYFKHPVELDSNGVPVDEYGKPIYENPFAIPDFFETIEDWISDINDSKDDVVEAADTGVSKLETVVTPLSTVISRVPFFAIFITFALAVIVIKKVIG